jgi:hypothetical protein
LIKTDFTAGAHVSRVLFQKHSYQKILFLVSRTTPLAHACRVCFFKNIAIKKIMSGFKNHPLLFPRQRWTLDG